ncbi:MAG: ROK family protein [Acidimicrobiales bacterium]|nr:ROK family protein [Acidimicrobiales bacterium]
MIVGVDVGGTNARALLVDPATGGVLGRRRSSSAGDGPALVHGVARMVEGLWVEGTVEAVGLGIAGLVDRAGTLCYSPNLPDLTGFPIGPELEEAVGVPVTVGNDASAATLAEARLGAGRGSDHFGLVTLGTGIGAGFVVDGRLLEGAHGFAGEAGHMVVDAHGPAHITGHQGPWEYFASGSALGRIGREAAATGGFDRGLGLAGSADGVTSHHVATALTEGDADAASIFDGFCREVARGVANLVVILDLERVVVGGGLTDMGEPLRSGIDQHLGDLLLGAEHRPAVDVRLAELGDDAGALGAALIAADRN